MSMVRCKSMSHGWKAFAPMVYGMDRRFIHNAPDYRRVEAMFEADREYHVPSCAKMQKHPQMLRRYFEVASVMHRKGKFPFLHAQSSVFRAARIFIETLAGDSQKNSHFKYFRMPSGAFAIDRDEVLGKIASTGLEPSSHILSMSYSLFECAVMESAQYFLFTNSSAAQGGVLEMSRDAVCTALQRRGMQSQVSGVMKVMDQFFADYAKLQLGTLYLIGVPKERMDRYVYDSHAFGRPTGRAVEQVIERDAFSLESDPVCKRALQARLMLFNETMTPSSGIEVVDVTDARECARYTQGYTMTQSDADLAYSYFFPHASPALEEDALVRERIDRAVRKYGEQVAELCKKRAK